MQTAAEGLQMAGRLVNPTQTTVQTDNAQVQIAPEPVTDARGGFFWPRLRATAFIDRHYRREARRCSARAPAGLR